jgi:hypothetical protein
MICGNGRIFGYLSTLPVDNEPIIWEVVTLSDDAILALAGFWEDVTLSHNAVLVLADFQEVVTFSDDGIRVNPGTKAGKMRLSRKNWR